MSQKPPRTGDQALVREINLSLIMNCLHRHAPISRAALAEMTGLNKSTVSSLVYELLHHRFVREVGKIGAKVGRPSVQLELNPQAGYIVSAEIGVGFIVVMGSFFTAEPFWQQREDTPRELGQEAIIHQTLELIRRAIEIGRHETDNQPLLGITIGVPGLLDRHTETLLFAPNLGWRDVPIGSILRSAFPDVPIFCDNEANMAAISECFFGAAQSGYDEVLYLSVGEGLGGAIVRGGILDRGKSGFAGEFGHITLYPDGDLCNCGNRGCWETRVSISAMFQHIYKAIESGQSSILAPNQANGHTGGRPLTVQQVASAAEAGDVVAKNALYTLGRELGVGIASLINAFNPDLVMIGGIITLAGAFILPIIQAEVERRALPWSAKSTEIVFSQHQANACVMGGVALVYQAILTHPSHFA